MSKGIDKLHDLKINGTGSAGGSTYNNVTINGNGNIVGDLDCVAMRVNGICSCTGTVKTERGKINGNIDIDGNLEAGKLKISGNLTAQGHLSVKELTIQGITEIKNSLSAEKIDMFGAINVAGDCTAEMINSKGAWNIAGLLNADQIDLQLHWQSQMQEIGGEKITIKRGKDAPLIKMIKAMFLKADFYTGQLTVETIEGDDIYLEYTEANVVRGNNVTIGPGCTVDLVEYKNNFHQTEDTAVKTHRKI